MLPTSISTSYITCILRTYALHLDLVVPGWSSLQGSGRLGLTEALQAHSPYRVHRDLDAVQCSTITLLQWSCDNHIARTAWVRRAALPCRLLVGAAVAGVAAVGASAGAAAGAASSNRGGGTTVVNNYGGK